MFPQPVLLGSILWDGSHQGLDHDVLLSFGLSVWAVGFLTMVLRVWVLRFTVFMAFRSPVFMAMALRVGVTRSVVVPAVLVYGNHGHSCGIRSCSSDNSAMSLWGSSPHLLLHVSVMLCCVYYCPLSSQPPRHRLSLNIPQASLVLWRIRRCLGFCWMSLSGLR